MTSRLFQQDGTEDLVHVTREVSFGHHRGTHWGDLQVYVEMPTSTKYFAFELRDVEENCKLFPSFKTSFMTNSCKSISQEYVASQHHGHVGAH